MATRPFSIDQPPAQPPEVSQQMPGLSAMFQRQVAAQTSPQTPDGAAPSGAGSGLQMMGDAVRKGIQQMSKDQTFAPFGERMLAQLDAGLNAAQSGAGSPGGQDNGAQTPGAQTPPNPTERSAAGSAGFPA